MGISPGREPANTPEPSAAQAIAWGGSPQRRSLTGPIVLLWVAAAIAAASYIDLGGRFYLWYYVYARAFFGGNSLPAYLWFALNLTGLVLLAIGNVVLMRRTRGSRTGGQAAGIALMVTAVLPSLVSLAWWTAIGITEAGRHLGISVPTSQPGWFWFWWLPRQQMAQHQTPGISPGVAAVLLVAFALLMAGTLTVVRGAARRLPAPRPYVGSGHYGPSVQSWQTGQVEFSPPGPQPSATRTDGDQPPGSVTTAPGLDGGPPYGASPYGGHPYGAYAPAPVPVPTNALAILALVFGILGGIAAIPLGHVALSQIKRTGESGRGLAIAGLVLGYLWLAGIAIIFLSIGVVAASLGVG